VSAGLVQNQASPIFWEILLTVSVVSTVVNAIIYRRTRLANGERRNFRLRSSIYLTFACIFLCAARLALS